MKTEIPDAGQDAAGTSNHSGHVPVKGPHVLSRYFALKAHIREERDQLASLDSDKFDSVLHQTEELHKLVRTQREQVADAEALLEITSSLASGAKEHCSDDGITPSDFVNSILKEFRNGGGRRHSVAWRDIGVAVSDALRRYPGCQTMIGPMDTELKARKSCTRKSAKLGPGSHPQKVANAAPADKSDTDLVMATMFGILKAHKRIRIENLVLNRSSFARTLENLFALSFLVKDGRVEIEINENGEHIVAPRNAPSARSVASGKAAYHHFMFRFDFKDWKLMSNSVWEGEELMPNRSNRVEILPDSPPDPELQEFSEDYKAELQATRPKTRNDNRRNVVEATRRKSRNDNRSNVVEATRPKTRNDNRRNVVEATRRKSRNDNCSNVVEATGPKTRKRKSSKTVENWLSFSQPI